MDESRFHLDSSDGRSRVYRRVGERFSDACVVERRAFGGGSVMVWGGITLNGRTPIVVIDGNLKAVCYRDDITQAHVIPFVQGQQRHIMLQQDNARPHVARVDGELFLNAQVTLAGVSFNSEQSGKQKTTVPKENVEQHPNASDPSYSSDQPSGQVDKDGKRDLDGTDQSGKLKTTTPKESVKQHMDTDDPNSNSDQPSSRVEEKGNKVFGIQIMIDVPIELVKVIGVFVEFSSNMHRYSWTPLQHLTGSLWTSPVFKFSCNITCLEYRCKVITEKTGWTPLGFISKIFGKNSEEKIDAAFRNVTKIGPVIRDFFYRNDAYSIECGLTQHVQQLLTTVHSDCLKDVVMQIDDLFLLAQTYIKTYHLKNLNIKNVLHELEGFLRSIRHYWEVHILFGYVCGLLVGGDTNKKTTVLRTISKETCFGILQSFKELTCNALPLGSLKVFENIVWELCLIAFPEQSSHIVEMLEYCYPALGTTFMMKCFRWSGSFSTYCDFETCNQICQKILKQKESGDEDAPQLLLTFLRHLPVNVTVDLLHNLILSKSLPLNDLINELELLVSDQCKMCSSTKDFRALIKFVNSLTSKPELMVTEVSKVIQDTVVHIMNRLKKSDSIDIDALIKLTESPVLFKSQESFNNLSVMIVGSENASIHGLFLKSLEGEQITGVSDELVSMWVMEWFSTAVKHHCCNKQHKSKYDDLPFVYKHLHCLLNTPRVSKTESLALDLKEEAFKFLCSLPLKELIKSLCGKGYAEKFDLPDVFSEHLIKLCSESGGKENILTTIGTSSTGNAFDVGTRPFRQLLTVAMDLSGLSEAETEVDKLRLMLKNRLFWVKLMNIQGVLSNEVKNREVFVGAHKLLKSFTRQLISEKLRCKDIKKLLNVEKDVITGSITDLLCSVEQSKKHVINKAWQSSKRLVREAERYLSVALNIVHHLDKANTQDLFLNIPDTKWAQICLERKKQKLNDDLPLSELSDGTFLSPLNDEVFNKIIIELLASQVFLTVCRDLVNMAVEHPPDDLKSICPEESLSKLFGEDSDPEDNDHRHDQFPTSILSVLKILNSKGIDKYEAAWRPLFSGDDCDISEVKKILDIPSLETEIKCAEQILKKKIPTWIRDAMKMYREYGIYEEKVQIVKQIMSILNTNENLDINFCRAVESFYALKKHTSHGITLKQLSETKEQLSYIHKIIVGDFF
ncbi:uncharacterized protein LOC121379532 [Gigantopelta aegis]|uniref:uncharacterized protein LOC121379532 n=1 Tax=Gigantopelta aegis TaxID=1735272 RepID=UPI001B88C2F6|nr:uncharacterized protein LOC121379532 [Gigantopelta aegis]